jgi:hypothetical protein
VQTAYENQQEREQGGEFIHGKMEGGNLKNVRYFETFLKGKPSDTKIPSLPV